jgi:hypothetical protein
MIGKGRGPCSSGTGKWVPLLGVVFDDLQPARLSSQLNPTKIL